MAARTTAGGVPVKLIAVLVVGVMAPVLDSTIVNVALRTLGRDLNAPVSTIQWVVTAYLLALGMAIPLTGWSVARFGAKRMWMVSLALFLVGSALCGLAWNVGALIAFRVVQGVGGGLMIPIMQTLLVEAAGGQALGRLMATVAMPALVGPILGPVVGGLIVDDLSWRWIFCVNIPVCLVAMVMAWRGLPATPARGGQRLDVLGLALLSPALATVIYGLSEAGIHHGFGHRAVTVPLAVGAALLAAFVVHALRTTTAEPVVDLRLFRSRAFTGAAGLLFLSGLSLYGAMLLLPLYYQQIRGASVVAAGLLLVPQGVGSLVSRTPLGRLSDRIGPRPVILGCLVLTALGTAGFAVAGAHTNQVLLAAAQFIRGAGLGGATLAVMAAAYQGLDRAEIPHASSATRIAQQVGGSFGAAVLAMILQRQSAGRAGTAAAQAIAFDHAFWWAVGFTILAFLPALLLPRTGRRRPAGADVPPVLTGSTAISGTGTPRRRH
ncbi:MAG: MDR family MFS transporter [Mycobacteriales bacterium]